MNLDALASKYDVQLPGDPTDLAEVRRVDDVALEFGEEVGITGTRFYIDQVAIEPTSKYRPTFVRGKSGNPRLYEEYYRGEPLVLDAVQSYTELLVAGRYDLPVPEDAPEEWRAPLKEFCDFYKPKLLSIEGGWERYVEHAASKLIFGFAPFEIVWEEDEQGRLYPRKLAFREQNTVEDWILDERGDALVAVRFSTGGAHPTYYTLPADKLLIANLNARGNNFEGIPPIRPAIHWIKTKRILAQIAAISAEKYGVPITQVRADPAYNEMFPGGMDDDRKGDVRQIYASMRAAEAPIIEMPDGLMAESVAPPGTMPDLLNLIQYCDQMIASCFSNEGSLLGLQSMVGSYALGEQKERDFLRSAPYYARKVIAPVNGMLRKLARRWFGDRMPPVVPEMVYRVDGMKDSSRWLDDVNKMLNNGQWRDIPEVRAAVYKELGIDVSRSDDGGASVKQGATDGAPPMQQKVADTALNGAQVTSMVTVVQQVALGQLPEESAIKVLEKAFLLSPEEARAIVSPAARTKAAKISEDEQAPAENVSMAEVADVNPESVRGKSAEALGDKLDALAKKHKEEWQKTVGKMTDPEKIQTAAKKLADKYEAQYVDLAVDAAEAVAVASAAKVAAELGVKTATVGGFDQSAKMQAIAIGEQAFGRVQGFLKEQQAEAVRATPAGAKAAVAFEFKQLGSRTMRSIADKAVVSAVHNGRDKVVRAMEEEGRTVVAIRRDPSGSDSCGPCKALNGYRAVYGSDEYFEFSPPNKCRGRNGCTCYWEYVIDEGDDE